MDRPHPTPWAAAGPALVAAAGGGAGAPDPDACYAALCARDARFDGRFVTAVRTTGIYCRPVCPARTPLRRNVAFFPHPAAAQAAGYRACRRCRPELAPDHPAVDWRGDLVGRALRLIADGVADPVDDPIRAAGSAAAGPRGVAALAAALHVTPRHLHRLFVAELGAGPLAVARARRTRLAAQLLTGTSLPVTEVAWAAGFGSVRALDAAVRSAHGTSPAGLRGAGSRHAPAALVLRLATRPPFDGTALLGFLADHAVPGVESVSGRTYRRTVRTALGPGTVTLTLPADTDGGPVARSVAVTLVADLPDTRALPAVTAACRRLLDLDADAAAIAAALGADPHLGPAVRRRPGLRLPGAFDAVELAARTVLGQQVSVAGGSTLTGRVAARAGDPVPAELTARTGLTHTFPSAAQLAAADLSGLGITGSRVRLLQTLGAAVAAGGLDLVAGDPVRTAASLLALPGCGPWTAGYLAMRLGRDPDSWLPADLALRRAAGRLGVPDTDAALAAHARRWSPWRAYAVQHLWASLADPAAAAGAVA